MDIFSDTGIENIREPYYFNAYIAILYFLKRFKNICLANIRPIIWDENTKKLTANNLYETVKVCQDNESVRFIFGFINIIIKDDAHQNVFIIDQKDNSVEIFEPHGTSFLTSPEYYTELKDLFLNRLEIKNFL